MRFLGVILVLIPLTLFSCGKRDKRIPDQKITLTPPVIAGESPADSLITRETKALWMNLKALHGKGILFGQQDANLVGVNWKFDENRSDIKDLTGTHPSLYGYELSGIGNESNTDSIPFELISKRMIEVFDRGGINTVSWHMNNPVTGGTAWDVTKAVNRILPDSILYEFYKSELRKIGSFFKG
ncbi:MAG TPA: glycosyl hydrolase, partial [Bacteroidales bacterium]|nr:glycosyl hydrolase [Bacteroidales bacterium]